MNRNASYLLRVEAGTRPPGPDGRPYGFPHKLAGRIDQVRAALTPENFSGWKKTAAHFKVDEVTLRNAAKALGVDIPPLTAAYRDRRPHKLAAKAPSEPRGASLAADRVAVAPVPDPALGPLRRRCECGDVFEPASLREETCPPCRSRGIMRQFRPRPAGSCSPLDWI